MKLWRVTKLEIYLLFQLRRLRRPFLYQKLTKKFFLFQKIKKNTKNNFQFL